MNNCKSIWNNDYFGFKQFYILLFAIFVFSIVLSCFFIPLIPVNNGTGWDGSVYYSILQSLCKGELGRGGEPYYFLRVGSIIHLLPVEAIFKNTEITLGAARFFSLCFAVSGIVLAVVASYYISYPSNGFEGSHLLISISSIYTFAVFTMPAFYPVLSDHLAIFISGLSLYLWQSNDRAVGKTCLCCLFFVSFFIMPSLFLIPGFLLVFPKQRSEISDSTHSWIIKWILKVQEAKFFWFFLSFITSIIVILYLYGVCSQATLHVQRSQIFHTTSGIPELRSVSMFLVLFVSGIAPFLFFLRFRKVITSFNPLSLILCGLLVVAFFVIYYKYSFSKAGFNGPNLIANLAQQALSSPMSSLPAIFSYLGPVGIIGIYIAMFGRLDCDFSRNRNSDTVAALSLFFIFFLLIGNETRQFICAFPLLAYLTCLAMNGQNILLPIYMCLFSLGLLLIGHPMDLNISSALNQNLDCMASQWQSYFGRQGPWMSMTSRLLWSSLLIIFLLGYQVVQKLKYPIGKNNS